MLPSNTLFTFTISLRFWVNRQRPFFLLPKRSLRREKKKRQRYAWLKDPRIWLIVAAITTVVIIVVLDSKPLTNARIELRLVVDSLQFTVGGDPNKKQRFTILNASQFSSLKLEDFTKIQVSAVMLKAHVPVRDGQGSTTAQNPTWLPVDSKGPVTIMGATNERQEMLRPSVLFQTAETTSNVAGYLDGILSSPGTRISLGSHELEEESSINITRYPRDPDRHSIRFVNRSNGTLEVGMTEEDDKECRVNGNNTPPGVRTTVAFRGPFRATVSNSVIHGVPKFAGDNESIMFQGALSADNPFVEILGERGRLRMSIGLTDVSLEKIFPKTAIPIRCIKFLSLNQDGEPETSLVDEGEVSYPDFPKKDKLFFTSSNYIWLGAISDFRIDGLSLDPQRQGIRVHASGRAPNLKIGTPEFFANVAPTCLDWVWYRNQSTIIGTAVVGVVGFLLGLIEALELGKREE